MFQEMPWIPSLARVMPMISLFIVILPHATCGLVRRLAVLGVAVAVILKDFLDDLGLELAVRALGDLRQVEILDRIAVGVELEGDAQRSEVGLFQSGGDRVLVGEIALHGLDGAVDQHRGIIRLEGVGTGHAVIGGLVGGDELLVLGVVEIGRPVRAAEHADRRVLLRRQGRFINRESREHRNAVGEARLLVLLDEINAEAAGHEREESIGLLRRNLGKLRLEVQRVQRHVGFFDDLALVVELEARDRVLAGLIIRHHQIHALVAAILRDLAEDFVHLIVLIRGHIEERVAVLAGKRRWAGIGLIRKVFDSVTGRWIAWRMLEKIGPTTKSTLSRSRRPLTLVTAASGLSSSSTTTTSTSRPPILPPRSLTPSAKPSRTCWPSAAAGPDRVTITPSLIFSWARAGLIAVPSSKAVAAKVNCVFMICPP